MRLSVSNASAKTERSWTPAVAPGLRIYVVGDLHGRADLLELCLSKIDEDIALAPSSRILHVFLGDYIDRGPSSRQTVDRLIERGAAHTCIFLQGNHELMAMRCLRDLRGMPQWLRLGGLETLLSYGISPTVGQTREQFSAMQKAFQEALSPAHFQFFSSLVNSFSCGSFFFVHAGVKPGVPLDRQKLEDLLWIRDEFLCSAADFGKMIVHGHTPVPKIDVRTNRINIDTGGYASNRLSCLILEGSEIHVIETTLDGSD